MNNIIFGSGIVGLMAKKLLRGKWTVVPFTRSRFYSFNPPLADNFISRDQAIDEAVMDLTGNNDVHFYKRCYSVQGQLVKNHDPAVASTWLSKIFGDRIPGHALPYFSKRVVTSIYPARVNILYQSLLREYIDGLREESAKGVVTEVGDHYFIRGGVRIDFDRAITTIPLPAMTELCGHTHRLKAADEYFVLVKSNKIDLEGCNQAFVADPLLDFYRVTAMSPDLFMFTFNREVQQPGAYLLPIIGSAEIVDGTRVPQSIPLGDIPDLKWLEAYGIHSIGSYAQWDWCSDVGSNILKIVKYGAANSIE